MPGTPSSLSFLCTRVGTEKPPPRDHKAGGAGARALVGCPLRVRFLQQPNDEFVSLFTSSVVRCLPDSAVQRLSLQHEGRPERTSHVVGKIHLRLDVVRSFVCLFCQQPLYIIMSAV